MNISEVMRLLQTIQDFQGDLEVCARDADGEHVDVIEVYADRSQTSARNEEAVYIN